MSYTDLFVVPVPKRNIETYRTEAETFFKVWRDHGALACVEVEGDDVPDGKVTSFPRSVALKDDEAVFVGDSPHDIQSGNDAGVITIAALWGPFRRDQLEPYHPTYFLDDIKGLPALLDRIATQNAG